MASTNDVKNCNRIHYAWDFTVVLRFIHCSLQSWYPLRYSFILFLYASRRSDVIMCAWSTCILDRKYSIVHYCVLLRLGHFVWKRSEFCIKCFIHLQCNQRASHKIFIDLLHDLGPWLQITHKHVQSRVNPDSKFFRALALNYSHLIHNHLLLEMAEHWLHVLV